MPSYQTLVLHVCCKNKTVWSMQRISLPYECEGYYGQAYAGQLGRLICLKGLKRDMARQSYSEQVAMYSLIHSDRKLGFVLDCNIKVAELLR